MIYGRSRSRSNHSHEHEFRRYDSEIEADRNHFIVYQYCAYHEVTASYTDHSRDETYEEVGYDCDASKATYLRYNWFVEYETGKVVSPDYENELFDEICAELVKCVAGQHVDDIGDVYVEYDGTEYHCRLTYKSSETSV